MVLAIAVALDQGARVLAEREGATRFQTSQNLATRPTIHIGGFPFLSQVARRRFSRVDVTAHDLTVSGSGRSVLLSTMQAHLADVVVSSSYKSATAASATGQAVIGYAAISHAAGFAVSYAGDGRIKGSTTLAALGANVTASVSAAVSITSGGDLQFVDLQASVNGQSIASGVVSALGDQFIPPLPLSGLPAGLRVRAIDVTASAVTVTLTGRDLHLTRG